MNAKRFAIRMKKELEVFMRNPPHGISCCPKEGNNVVLEAVIIGPDGSPYEGGIFHLDLNIPDEYPFYPPRVRFLTTVYHPNIDEHGRICLDILKVPPNGCWRCTCSIANVLIGVQCLLSEPNAEDPLNPDIAAVFSSNREQFNEIAKEYTKRYAKFERPPTLPEAVITSPLLRSKFASKTLSNIPADCELEGSSPFLVSSILEIDKEIEREPIDEPRLLTRISASSSKISSSFQPHSSSPKLSIMEPDLLETDDEKEMMSRIPGTSLTMCLPSTSKQSSQFSSQLSPPSPYLSIMEPDLTDSDAEDEKSMYSEPGPSSKLFLPSRSLPKISSMSITGEDYSIKDFNENSEYNRKRAYSSDLGAYSKCQAYKKPAKSSYELDPNLPSTSGLNLKRSSSSGGVSESEAGSSKKHRKSP